MNTRPAVRIPYLVFGLLYLGIVISWSLASSGAVSWHASQYLFPAVLVGAGGIGLVASLTGRKR